MIIKLKCRYCGKINYRVTFAPEDYVLLMVIFFILLSTFIYSLLQLI